MRASVPYEVCLGYRVAGTPPLVGRVLQGPKEPARPSPGEGAGASEPRGKTRHGDERRHSSHECRVHLTLLETRVCELSSERSWNLVEEPHAPQSQSRVEARALVEAHPDPGTAHPPRKITARRMLGWLLVRPRRARLRRFSLRRYRGSGYWLLRTPGVPVSRVDRASSHIGWLLRSLSLSGSWLGSQIGSAEGRQLGLQLAYPLALRPLLPMLRPTPGHRKLLLQHFRRQRLLSLPRLG